MKSMFEFIGVVAVAAVFLGWFMWAFSGIVADKVIREIMKKDWIIKK